jgi:predicted ribosome quality control (RQC) complex YloA/Tae2 family protein
MIANYYTLRHIALDLQRRINGTNIGAAFCQQRNELIVEFDRAGSSVGNEDKIFLVVSCEPSDNFIYVHETFARSRRNSVDLFPEIIGKRVRSVSIHPSDREISIVSDEHKRLVIQMFASKANVVLVDSDDQIIDSFLRSKEVTGTSFNERERSTTGGKILDSLNRIRSMGGVAIGPLLRKILPQFGGTLVRELLFRSRIEAIESADRLTDEALSLLIVSGQEMMLALETAYMPQIYLNGTTPVEFSIIPLRHLLEMEVRRFDSLHDAIRIYHGLVRRNSLVISEKSRIRQHLAKEREKITHSLDSMAHESTPVERADQFERLGTLLTKHLHELRKGMEEAIVEDSSSESPEVLSIPLDRNLTPGRNADRYFEKAKKIRAALEKHRQRVADLRSEMPLIQTLLTGVEAVGSSADLDEYLRENHEALERFGIVKAIGTNHAELREVPFRVFQVTGEFVVWAGKSGENNDLLTTRHTKARDLWFHARGVGGSHVVLKIGTGKGEVTRTAIHEAASIAAYYSKMKSSGLVPVAYCEGKYVRKPKGAAPGTVTIERETVIMVEPRLPGN